MRGVIEADEMDDQAHAGIVVLHLAKDEKAGAGFTTDGGRLSLPARNA